MPVPIPLAVIGISLWLETELKPFKKPFVFSDAAIVLCAWDVSRDASHVLIRGNQGRMPSMLLY
jgi:hypothetical protein